VRDILAGVAHIGRRGVVHRDIKASNVLIDEYGKAKLSDFGLVKKEVEKTHTQTHTKYFSRTSRSSLKAMSFKTFSAFLWTDWRW
jgi:serine/threonine protein kinase